MPLRLNIFLGLLIACSTLNTACGSRSNLTTLASDSDKRFWPVSFPSDAQLNQEHALMPYMKAAVAKELPLRYFRELIGGNKAISVLEGDWPSYRPGYFYGGTIYMPSAGNPRAWSRGEWASFYNELFHAWYGQIFRTSDSYTTTRAQVWTEERTRHYRKANPSDPALAQEEAWSETVATLMIQLSPTKIDNQTKYPSIDKFAYEIGRTVAPVSHSDRPGYTPEAETTYPAEWEYVVIFRTLTMVSLH